MARKTKTRTDADRLEWLATSDAYMAHSNDGDCCWLVWPHGRGDDLSWGEQEVQEGEYSTIREAIDAAMDEDEV